MIAAHQTMLAPPALPYDAEVEYLESTGTQYVDTGFAPSFPSLLEYKARVRYPNTTTRQIMGLQGGMYFGVVNGGFQPGLASSTTVSASMSANVVYDVGAVYHLPNAGASKHNRQIDWTVGSLTGTVYGDLYQYLPATATIWLFWANDANTLRGASAIYSFQILSNSVLVRDYIPVRVGQVGYLYDRVSGELFGNAGTGAFTIGPDKT